MFNYVQNIHFKILDQVYIDERQSEDYIFPVIITNPKIMILCGILQFIIPGSGLFIINFYQKPYYYLNWLLAILQLILTFFLIGYIWSIINGYLMIKVAIKNRSKINEELQKQQDQLYNIQQQYVEVDRKTSDIINVKQ